MQKTINKIDIQKKLQEVQAIVRHNICVSEKTCQSVAKSNGTLKKLFGSNDPVKSH